jgi:hypothetical protein
MLREKYIEGLFQRLHDIAEIGPPLSADEIDDIQTANGFQFPPDFLDLLRRGVPAGPGFPTGTTSTLCLYVKGFHVSGTESCSMSNIMLSGTRAGERDPTIGPSPVNRPAAGCSCTRAGARVRLVYGFDLEDYLQHEFFGAPHSERPLGHVHRWIEFWSELARMNQSWPDEWMATSSDY